MTKNRNSRKIKIVAHSGGFHADDVFAVATLLLALGEERCEVVRSRDEATIAHSDYVVDVGGVYDAAKNRFDHHQRGGAGARENGIPYASFGLVWKKSGEQLVRNAGVGQAGSRDAAENIDRLLVQPIDAYDNGVIISTSLFEGIASYAIGQAISALKPQWGEVERTMEEGFFEAIALAKTVLTREIALAKGNAKMSKAVERVYRAAEDKRLILFDDGNQYGWQATARMLARHPEPLFFIRKHEDGNWEVVGVPETPEYFFTRRKGFPESWAGLRNDALADASGVPDAVFCHRTRFKAVAGSKAGAFAMARTALALPDA